MHQWTQSNMNYPYCTVNYSGVGSNHALQGPPKQIMGVALVIELYDHSIPFIKVIIRIVQRMSDT